MEVPVSTVVDESHEEWAVPEDVALVRWWAYKVLGSMIVGLATFTNGVCLMVSFRKKPKQLYINLYIRLLATSDLLGCLFSLIWLASSDECVFHSYGKAIYNAFFGKILFNMARSLSFFTIIWLSYDRFLAVWSYERFRSVQNPVTFYRRLLVTMLLCVLAFVPLWINSKVISSCNGPHCDSDGNSSLVIWISIDGWSHDLNDPGFLVIMGVREFIFRIIPSLLLISLSLGLVVALAMKRHESHCASSSRVTRKCFYNTVTILAINISFVLCVLPSTVINLVLNRRRKGHCFASATVEAWNAFGALLLGLWNALNVVFILTLNEEYRIEMKNMLASLPLVGHFCFSNLQEVKSLTDISKSRPSVTEI